MGPSWSWPSEVCKVVGFLLLSIPGLEPQHPVRYWILKCVLTTLPHRTGVRSNKPLKCLTIVYCASSWCLFLLCVCVHVCTGTGVYLISDTLIIEFYDCNSPTLSHVWWYIVVLVCVIKISMWGPSCRTTHHYNNVLEDLWLHMYIINNDRQMLSYFTVVGMSL